MDDGNRATPIVYINCVDTLQYSFASHLSMEFLRKGISSFINSKGTLDVIERASASVIVFSDNCLSSTSHLDKLVSVLQCRRKNGLVLVPVFYCISPSDVLVLEHKRSGSADQIIKWSSALQEMRDLPGHQFREECSECEFVEEIVKDVHEKLFPTEQIGINSRLLELEQLLCKQPWGIRRIGIWGMPGIGKTTLAKAFFDQICGGYEASCLIKHFDKAFHEKGLHRLLEEHFGKILKEMPRVCSSITRPSLPRDKLSKKRTLAVLDDLHNSLVFESFLRGIHWFGPGSLIIITSRDKQVFRLCQINHVYEVQSLNEAEALQLFYQCACVKDMREQNLLKLSMEVVDYASGNPLALRFYGGELKGKKLSEMETTFLKLKLRMPYKIHDLFKSSYETLNDNEKNIFLDIACFFNGENVGYVMRLLEGCGFFPHVGIDVLVEKCLVTISENRVKMHRIIQDFGREIINGETVQIERRRRLWEPWTIKFLLEDDQLKTNGDLKATYTRALGTEDIEGIFLDTSNLLFDVKPTAFENMLNLRFLKIYCSNYDNHSGLRLPNGLESLPYELRLLHWENYPLQSLPQDFDSCHLVELSMSYSQLQKLWGGTKNIDMLKMVRLCHSQLLTQIDDICKAKNIELIDLQGCTKLQSFPATGQLQHLRVVNLSGCREIKSFPEVSPNIEELHLQGTGIRELPISVVTLSGQDKLHRELSNLLTEFSDVSNDLNLEILTSRVQVVSSKQHLSKLVSLNMKDCVHLRSLPHMVDLESLKFLNMSGCSKLDDIQSFPRNLKELYLAGTAIKRLPQLPWSIEIMNAHGCMSLRSIPFAFEQLPRYYTFSNCFALSAQVIIFFVENALTNVERIAREYQQEQKLNKSLASSFTVPSPASKKITFDLQSGSSVMIQLGSSWRNTLGFAILVEVAFSEDYHEAGGFGISCICRWKDEECVSHRLEKNLNYWTTGEGVPKDHMFVFCDLNMYPGTCEGNDYTILAELVVFEFFTVNKQEESLDKSCTVTKCGVYVITAADRDTSPNVTQSFSSDYLQELSDNEIQDVLRVILDGLDENEITLFLYITCLFNDEESDLLALFIASNGLGISLGLEVLASKSLIHISPYGVIVRHGLLQKIGREIIYRQSTVLPKPNVSSEILHRPAYPSSKKVKDWDKLKAEMKKQAYMLSSIPNCAEFFADRAQACIKLESFTEAVADADIAIELDPSLTKAYLRKGTAYMKLEEYRTAKTALEKGASIAPSESKFKKLIDECDLRITEEEKDLIQPVPSTLPSSSTAPSVSELDLTLAPAAPAKAKYRHEYYQKPEEVGRALYVLVDKTPKFHDIYTLSRTRKLGQGQYGTTYLCTEVATGIDYACKSISKRKLICIKDVEDVRREIQIMYHLAGHGNIVTIKGAYEDSLYVHIVMELCAGGELFDRIILRGHYSERKAAELTKIIVGVVEACHSLGVMHRDLKPENFLLVNEDDDFSLKAIGFGLSIFFKPGQIFTDVVGSPYYVAPEVLLKRYGPEADVWTAGVILYILLSGVPPFWAETQEGILDAVLKGYIDFESDPWPAISDSAKHLIRRMLSSKPAERLTAHEVLRHPWICKNGVAPDRALDPAVLSRLKQFSAMNKLKKMALKVIAESLSEEEIAGLREMFQAMDTHNSGAITFDELKAGLRKYGSTLKDTEVHDLMEAADVDNSGTIDYGEFIAATIHLNKLEREEHLVSAFQYFDKDGSGYITIDELQQACVEHGMADVFLEDIIKEVDQNNDGKIDYDEFVEMMQKGNAGVGRRTMRNSRNICIRDV